jgi:predicted Zn-dependent protease with MMP-like domain
MEEFERMVSDALREIPRKFKKVLEKEGIRIIVRESPPPVFAGRRFSDIVFGVFIGVPYGPGRYAGIAEATRIEIYKESFERVFSGEDEIRRQVKKTVIHEIGHYFGFDEQYLRRQGY